MAEWRKPIKSGKELETANDKSIIIGKRIKDIMENWDMGETFLIFDDDTSLELSCSIDSFLIWAYHESAS